MRQIEKTTAKFSMKDAMQPLADALKDKFAAMQALL